MFNHVGEVEEAAFGEAGVVVGHDGAEGFELEVGDAVFEAVVVVVVFFESGGFPFGEGGDGRFFFGHFGVDEAFEVAGEEVGGGFDVF